MQSNLPDSSTLTGSVCHHFFGVWLQVRRETDARMLSHGLTDAQWKPLWMIKIGRASTAHEVARIMGIDASAVTRLISTGSKSRALWPGCGPLRIVGS